MPVWRQWLAANKLAIVFVLILVLAIGSWWRSSQEDEQAQTALRDLAVEMVVEVDKETGRVEFETTGLTPSEDAYRQAVDALRVLLQIEESYIQRFDQFPGQTLTQLSVEFLDERINNHRRLALWLELEEYDLSEQLTQDQIVLDDDLRSDIRQYSTHFPDPTQQQQVERLLDIDPSEWDSVTWPQPSPALKSRRLLSADHSQQLQSIRNEIESINEELE